MRLSHDEHRTTVFANVAVLHIELSYTNKSASNATEISVSGLVAAVESGDFNLDASTSMDGTQFCGDIQNEIREIVQCLQAKNISTIIRT